MEKLQYKTFVWPQNPHTYREKMLRIPQYQKDLEGIVTFRGLGDKLVEITAEGVFFGDTAFQDYKNLAALMEETSYGTLTHPVWGVRYGYMTGLEMTQEPRENYVSYRFTFTGMVAGGDIPPNEKFPNYW